MGDGSGSRKPSISSNASLYPEHNLLVRFRHVYAGKGGWFYTRRKNLHPGKPDPTAEADPLSSRNADFRKLAASSGLLKNSVDHAQSEINEGASSLSESTTLRCITEAQGSDTTQEAGEASMSDRDKTVEVARVLVGASKAFYAMNSRSPRRAKHSRMSVFSRMSQEAQWAMNDFKKDMQSTSDEDNQKDNKICPLPTQNELNEELTCSTQNGHDGGGSNSSDCTSSQVASNYGNDGDLLEDPACITQSRGRLRPVAEVQLGKTQQGKHVCSNLTTKETLISPEIIVPTPRISNHSVLGPNVPKLPRIISKGRDSVEAVGNHPFKYRDMEGNSTLFKKPKVLREKTFEITPLGYDSRFKKNSVELLPYDIPEEVKIKAQEKCNDWLKKYT